VYALQGIGNHGGSSGILQSLSHVGSMNAHSGTEVTAVHEVATHEFPKDSKPLFSPPPGTRKNSHHITIYH